MSHVGKKTKKLAHKPQAYGAGQREDTTLVRATIHGETTLATTAGGVVNGYVNMDPSTLTNTDWADFSGTYDEFRVMGVRVTCTSIQANTAVNNSFIALAFDNDSASVSPGSLSAVRQYSTSKLLPAVWSTKPISFTWWRPTQGGDTAILWCDVATPSQSLGQIPIYTSGLNGTSNYIFMLVEMFCEFRGRR